MSAHPTMPEVANQLERLTLENAHLRTDLHQAQYRLALANVDYAELKRDVLAIAAERDEWKARYYTLESRVTL